MEGILTEVSNQEQDNNHHLVSIELDEESIGFISQEVDHERRVAIFDLVEQNYFRIQDTDQGPYCLQLSTRDRRLVMRIRHHMDPAEKSYELILSMAPFKSIIRDYFMLCESYYEAIRHAPPHSRLRQSIWAVGACIMKVQICFVNVFKAKLSWIRPQPAGFLP